MISKTTPNICILENKTCASKKLCQKYLDTGNLTSQLKSSCVSLYYLIQVIIF